MGVVSVLSNIMFNRFEKGVGAASSSSLSAANPNSEQSDPSFVAFDFRPGKEFELCAGMGGAPRVAWTLTARSLWLEAVLTFVLVQGLALYPRTDAYRHPSRAANFSHRSHSPSSPARFFIASMQKAMCASRSTPSPAAPWITSARLTPRAKALSFIFLRTLGTSTSAMALVGFTNAHAVRNPASSSQANKDLSRCVTRGTPEY